MNEYITLLGTEDVRNAGGSMRAAANDMMHAASTISEAVTQHQNILDEFIDRFEIAIEKINKEKKK